jgi:tripartite-type tricarboxylate transporter receptor subunit TctC/ABC-type uncharacterized transport system substrate-binding protein
MPVVGLVHYGSPGASAIPLTAFHKGLGESGYIEGRNVAIEHRWAQNDYSRLPELLADLVRRRVTVIATPGGHGAALSAKKATATIPIVFGTGGDPVKDGVVASLNRPGGNVTGITYMNVDLVAKRIGLLNELRPTAAQFAALIDPRISTITPTVVEELHAAGSNIGRRIEVIPASTSGEIDAAFSSLLEKRSDGLVVPPFPFFFDRRLQILTLAARYGIPTIYPAREWADAGGIMSYGSSYADLFRQVGSYAGRVLKGEKPADLPILRATKFELVINFQTARVIGIDIPPMLLARADDVIERVKRKGGSRMKLPRRKFLHLAAGAAALPAVSRIARAQAYPTRPVRIIAGYPPGGSIDIHARLIGQWLSQRLGQPFVVENRPGAGGNVGSEAAAHAAPDGYTLLISGIGNTISATLYDKLKYDFIRDFAPVAGVMRAANVIDVHPSVPVNSVPELIAYAKANPGKVTMGSPGVGTSPHLSGELFKLMTGVDMLHVPYRGNAPALTDLLAGQLQVLFDGISSSIEHIRSGKVRALAVTTATRVPSLPDVPTVGEFVPGYEVSVWFSVSAPRNTPPEIIATLNREINAGLADPKLKARLVELGGAPMPMTPAEVGKLIASETEKWAKVIRAANIKPE